MKRRTGLAAALLVLLAFLTSCAGTLSVGFEQTPTPDPAPQATLEALVEENQQLATALATAIAPPSPVPTALGRVAYIRGGDLWVTQLPEGPYQRLTIDGHNREPRWASSGEWIAYRKDRTVLVERERPCQEPLRQGEPPCHETVSTFQQQVWLARRSGADQHVINHGFTVERFAWSPEGDVLAYVNENGDLQRLDPATNIELRLVSSQGGGRVSAISWSPDGARLAYEWVTDEQTAPSTGREDGVWVVPATGGQSLRVARSAQATSLAGWQDADAVLIWEHPGRTPQPQDGVRLFSAALPVPGQGATPAQIVVSQPMLPRPDFLSVAPAGQHTVAATVGTEPATWTDKRVVAGTFESEADEAATTPSWSPDGKDLAFVAMPDAPGLTLGEDALTAMLSRHIQVATLGTGASQALTQDPRYRDERPQWSRQGNQLLFARMTREGQASLWLIAAEGGAPALVVDELTPAPDPIGTYGYVDWAQYYDWWRG
ncbi:MAG: TolB family protein [Nitrososphaerales archaeon]